MMDLTQEAKVSQWGNSKAIRLPLSVVQALDLKVDDSLSIGVDSSKRLVIDKLESTPQTIEELFAGYEGGSFRAKVQDLKAVGNERW